MSASARIPRFTDGRPRIATGAVCKARWGGVKDGELFRCGFCGHRFKPGDYYRWQYTNDTRAWGNPFICAKCDEGPEKAREQWARKWAEFRKDAWWWFRQCA